MSILYHRTTLTDKLAPCLHCKSTVASFSNEMVFCDRCNACFHQNCHVGLRPLPLANRSWYCARCVQEHHFADLLYQKHQDAPKVAQYRVVVTPPPFVKNVYSSMKLANTIGGDGSGGALYGEITITSMHRIVTFLQEFCNLNSQAYFIDIGSGLGKPNIHVSAATTVKLSFGLELEELRYKLSLLGLQSIIPYFKAEQRPMNIRFKQGDAQDLRSLNPFTHIYQFDLGFPPILQVHLTRVFNSSTSAKYLVSFKNPRNVIFEFGYAVKHIGSIPTSMFGSHEQHMAYVYEKVDSLPENPIQDLIPCLPPPKPQTKPKIVLRREARERAKLRSEEKKEKRMLQQIRELFTTISDTEVVKIQLRLLKPKQVDEMELCGGKSMSTEEEKNSHNISSSENNSEAKMNDVTDALDDGNENSQTRNLTGDDDFVVALSLDICFDFNTYFTKKKKDMFDEISNKENLPRMLINTTSLSVTTAEDNNGIAGLRTLPSFSTLTSISTLPKAVLVDNSPEMISRDDLATSTKTSSSLNVLKSNASSVSNVSNVSYVSNVSDAMTIPNVPNTSNDSFSFSPSSSTRLQNRKFIREIIRSKFHSSPRSSFSQSQSKEGTDDSCKTKEQSSILHPISAIMFDSSPSATSSTTNSEDDESKDDNVHLTASSFDDDAKASSSFNSLPRGIKNKNKMRYFGSNRIHKVSSSSLAAITLSTSSSSADVPHDIRVKTETESNSSMESQDFISNALTSRPIPKKKKRILLTGDDGTLISFPMEPTSVVPSIDPDQKVITVTAGHQNGDMTGKRVEMTHDTTFSRSSQLRKLGSNANQSHQSSRMRIPASSTPFRRKATELENLTYSWFLEPPVLDMDQAIASTSTSSAVFRSSPRLSRARDSVPSSSSTLIVSDQTMTDVINSSPSAGNDTSQLLTNRDSQLSSVADQDVVTGNTEQETSSLSLPRRRGRPPSTRVSSAKSRAIATASKNQILSTSNHASVTTPAVITPVVAPVVALVIATPLVTTPAVPTSVAKKPVRKRLTELQRLSYSWLIPNEIILTEKDDPTLVQEFSKVNDGYIYSFDLEVQTEESHRHTRMEKYREELEESLRLAAEEAQKQAELTRERYRQRVIRLNQIYVEQAHKLEQERAQKAQEEAERKELVRNQREAERKEREEERLRQKQERQIERDSFKRQREILRHQKHRRAGIDDGNDYSIHTSVGFVEGKTTGLSSTTDMSSKTLFLSKRMQKELEGLDLSDFSDFSDYLASSSEEEEDERELCKNAIDLVSYVQEGLRVKDLDYIDPMLSLDIPTTQVDNTNFTTSTSSFNSDSVTSATLFGSKNEINTDLSNNTDTDQMLRWLQTELEFLTDEKGLAQRREKRVTPASPSEQSYYVYAISSEAPESSKGVSFKLNEAENDSSFIELGEEDLDLASSPITRALTPPSSPTRMPSRTPSEIPNETSKKMPSRTPSQISSVFEKIHVPFDTPSDIQDISGTSTQDMGVVPAKRGRGRPKKPMKSTTHKTETETKTDNIPPTSAEIPLSVQPMPQIANNPLKTSSSTNRILSQDHEISRSSKRLKATDGSSIAISFKS